MAISRAVKNIVAISETSGLKDQKLDKILQKHKGEKHLNKLPELGYKF